MPVFAHSLKAGLDRRCLDLFAISFFDLTFTLFEILLNSQVQSLHSIHFGAQFLDVGVQVASGAVFVGGILARILLVILRQKSLQIVLYQWGSFRRGRV